MKISTKWGLFKEIKIKWKTHANIIYVRTNCQMFCKKAYIQCAQRKHLFTSKVLLMFIPCQTVMGSRDVIKKKKKIQGLFHEVSSLWLVAEIYPIFTQIEWSSDWIKLFTVRHRLIREAIEGFFEEVMLRKKPWMFSSLVGLCCFFPLLVWLCFAK
jgi:hypothetical protein